MVDLNHNPPIYLTEEEMRILRRKHADELMYKAVYEKFREIWLVKDEDIDRWFGYGENTIEIRFKNKEVFIFTYYTKAHWKIHFEHMVVGALPRKLPYQEVKEKLYMYPLPKGEKKDD